MSILFLGLYISQLDLAAQAGRWRPDGIPQIARRPMSVRRAPPARFNLIVSARRQVLLYLYISTMSNVSSLRNFVPKCCDPSARCSLADLVAPILRAMLLIGQ